MSALLIVAIILFVLGNAIEAVQSIQGNRLPGSLFLIVDSAVLLYVLTGVVK